MICRQEAEEGTNNPRGGQVLPDSVCYTLDLQIGSAHLAVRLWTSAIRFSVPEHFINENKNLWGAISLVRSGVCSRVSYAGLWPYLPFPTHGIEAPQSGCRPVHVYTVDV